MQGTQRGEKKVEMEEGGRIRGQEGGRGEEWMAGGKRGGRNEERKKRGRGACGERGGRLGDFVALGAQRVFDDDWKHHSAAQYKTLRSTIAFTTAHYRSPPRLP
eukprot:63863-Rhodomonas_salina.6